MTGTFNSDPIYITDTTGSAPWYNGYYSCSGIMARDPLSLKNLFIQIRPLGSDGFRTTNDPISIYAGNIAVYDYNNTGNGEPWVRHGLMLGTFPQSMNSGDFGTSLSISDDGCRLLASTIGFDLDSLTSYVFKRPNLLSNFILSNLLILKSAASSKHPYRNKGIFGLSGDGKVALQDYGIYYLDSLPSPDKIIATPSVKLNNETGNGVMSLALGANYLSKGTADRYQIVSDQGSAPNFTSYGINNETFYYDLRYNGSPVADQKYKSTVKYDTLFIGSDQSVSRDGSVYIRSFLSGGVRSVLFNQSNKQIITAPTGTGWFGSQVEMNPDGRFFTCIWGRRLDASLGGSEVLGKCTYARMGQRFFNQLEQKPIYSNVPAVIYPITNLPIPAPYVTDSKCLGQIANIYGTDANLLGMFREMDEGQTFRSAPGQWHEAWLATDYDMKILFASNATGTNGPVLGKASVAMSEDGVSFVVGSLFSNNGTGAIELYTRDVLKDGRFYGWDNTTPSVFKGADFLFSTVDKAKLKYPLFGYSVTILGTIGNRWIAVGAPKAYDGKGLVWIWRVDERDTATPDTFILMGETIGEEFGTSVKIFKNPDTTYMTLAVGTTTGKVKIFTKTGPSTAPFEPTGIIVAPDGPASGFGREIKVTRDGVANIVITAPKSPYQGTKELVGVIYVYSSDGTTLLRAYRPEAPQSNDQTGDRASDRFFTTSGSIKFGYKTITAIGSPGRNNGSGQIEITFEDPYP